MSSYENNNLRVSKRLKIKEEQKYLLGGYNIPDAVIQSQIMLFLGPKFLLPTVGSISKRFRALAESDVVWKVFCSWHGAKQSKVFKKIVEVCNKEIEQGRARRMKEEKVEALKQWYEAFDEAATDGTNVMSRYKELVRGGLLRLAHSQGVECMYCVAWGPREGTLQDVCAHPTCDNAICSCDFEQAFDECRWCHIQTCQYEEVSHNDLPILHGCDECGSEFVCLDCMPIVGQQWTSRKCTNCGIHLCPSCIWTLDENDGLTAMKASSPETVADDQVRCYTCAAFPDSE